MKTIVAFIIILITSLNAIAQNVGIGTDNPLEKLDIHGNINLTGKIFLNGLTGLTGEVLISKGVGAPPEWGPGRVGLPFSGTATTSATGFSIVQASTGTAASFSINNAASGNTALQVNSQGTGFAAQVFSTNAVPKALRTSGAIQFTGIGEGTGKTLMSDEAGVARWEAPIAFMAYLNTSSNVLNGSLPNVVSGLTEVFDEGNDFANSVFTVPRNGIYHFDVSMKWGTNTVANFVQATLQKCDQAGSNCVILASSKMNNQLATQQAFGVDCKLEAGNKIKVVLNQTNVNGSSRTLEGVDANNNITTFFSGHLVKQKPGTG